MSFTKYFIFMKNEELIEFIVKFKTIVISESKIFYVLGIFHTQ